ncbi:MAG: glycosyltransferase family 9 protein, partial [Flavobacteriales bacterium]
MKTVLVIRFSSIGDAVLVNPVLHQLKAANYRVLMLTKSAFEPLFSANPNVDELLVIKELNSDFLTQLKQKGIDMVVDLHNNSWSRKVTKHLGISPLVLNKQNLKKALLVWTKCSAFAVRPIVERYLETIQPLVSKPVDISNQMYLSPASEALQHFDFSDYFVYVIGGQHEGKIMSQNRILELLNLNKHRVILIGGPEDVEKGAFLVKHSENQNVESLAGKLNLTDSMHILSKAKFVMSHDTGLMHVAAGFQKNIISLWGTTSPSLGFAPYKPGEHSV